MTDPSMPEKKSESDDVAAPLQKEAARREAWVGVFVIFGVLAVLAALFTFTSPSTFRGRYFLSSTVDEAGGVRRGDPVQYRGVAIGRVRSFDIAQAGVTLRLEIENRYRVPRDSHVELASNALIGGSVARIVPGQSSEVAPSGAVLPGTAARPLTDTVSDVAAESKETMKRVQDLLSQRTVNGVEGSVEQLQALLRQLAETTAAQRGDVERLTHDLSIAATHAQKLASSPELERSVKRLDAITAKLDDAATSFDRASTSMSTMMGRIERGEGTLGKLAKDDSLYLNANAAIVNMNQATTQVRALAMDLRLNPKRYVHISLF
jgi:phospholipid/cholesterol/gamma-HCH transport system substrate-binding protein